ncbi:hypothetical protein Agub_g5331, partial [Astrephomene gubernaculifera]
MHAPQGVGHANQTRTAMGPPGTPGGLATGPPGAPGSREVVSTYAQPSPNHGIGAPAYGRGSSGAPGHPTHNNGAYGGYGPATHATTHGSHGAADAHASRHGWQSQTSNRPGHASAPPGAHGTQSYGNDGTAMAHGSMAQSATQPYGNGRIAELSYLPAQQYGTSTAAAHGLSGSGVPWPQQQPHGQPPTATPPPTQPPQPQPPQPQPSQPPLPGSLRALGSTGGPPSFIGRDGGSGAGGVQPAGAAAGSNDAGAAAAAAASFGPWRKGLNEDQLQAVTSSAEEPQLIIAGAGTGKTTT